MGAIKVWLEYSVAIYAIYMKKKKELNCDSRESRKTWWDIQHDAFIIINRVLNNNTTVSEDKGNFLGNLPGDDQPH